MINPFYNADEKRLRALWRILLHFLFIASSIFVIFIPIVTLAMLSGDQPPTAEELSSPPVSTTFSLTQFIVPLIVISLSLWVFGRYVDRRPFGEYGLWVGRAAWWRDLGFGMLLGAVLMAGVFLVEWALGWVSITETFATGGRPFAMSIWVPVMTYISVGIYEEMLSRGYHLLNFAEGFNLPWLPAWAALVLAWLVSSSVFGVLHALNPNASVISTFNLILAGMFLGLGFVLTRSLAIPIGLHITWNFFQGNVFGFPVSGMDAGVTFIAIQQGGPQLWTGGAFGPEAGIIGVVAIVTGMLLTTGYVYAVYGDVRLQTALAIYTPHANDANRQPSGQSTE